jgi:hypothetical protein
VLKTYPIRYPSLFKLLKMSSLSEQIASHPFFTTDVSGLPFDERIVLAYQRAILILRTYSMIPIILRLYTLLNTLSARFDG